LEEPAAQRGPLAHAEEAVPAPGVAQLVAAARPSPSSSIESTISLGSYETVTDARALPACLSALVSASCTIL
jgi:hypothetical protein